MVDTFKKHLNTIFGELKTQNNLGHKIIEDYKSFPIIEENVHHFLEIDDEKSHLKQYTLSNADGVEIKVLNYGATILSITMPDNHYNAENILLGFDDFSDYNCDNHCKTGSIFGRTSQIVNKNFSNPELNEALKKKLEGTESNYLDKVIWNSYVDKSSNTLILSHLSQEQDEDQAAHVLIRISMKLSNENEFITTINAITDVKTPIDISQRLYFNLGGHDSGSHSIRNHFIMINADCYIEQDEDGNPIGPSKNVNETQFDLRTSKQLDQVQKVQGEGHGQFYCLKDTKKNHDGLMFAARLEYPTNGRNIEIWTNAPSLYFDIGNLYLSKPKLFGESNHYIDDKVEKSEFLLNESDPKGIRSKKHKLMYFKNGAILMSPQGCPNTTANDMSSGSNSIKPHEHFERKIMYKFGVAKNTALNENSRYFITKQAGKFKTIYYE